MIDSLHTKMESQFGLVITRLCRVFYEKSHSHSRFRRFCCFPTFVLVTFFVLMLFALALVIRIKGSFSIQSFNSEEQIFTVTLVFIICLSILISSPTWLKIILVLIRPSSAKLMKAVHTRERRNSNQESKLEGFIFKLKQEVDLIAYTLRTIDTFTHGCTRLVIIIDGLDSCEQRKVLQILEIIHVLFTKEGDPFISILAVDPHFLIRGGEGAGNFTDIFKNGTVNGHDYLRTVIHLPVYLQNNLPMDKTKWCQHKKFINPVLSMSQELKPKIDETSKEMSNKKNKKNRGREKSRNRNGKAMTTHHLTDQMIRNEYFIDVNPRNLRRLINEIALTARLLRAYHITFDWRLLASWVYLNEQWPYRCSWLIMYIKDNEENLSDECTFQQIYEKVKHKIPVSNEPLLELDRNANKFERFLNNSQLNLTVHVIKQILPYTVNIDPYFIKLIRDSLEIANTNDTYYSSNHQVPGSLTSDVHLPYSLLNSHPEFKQMKIPHPINESRIHQPNLNQTSHQTYPLSSTLSNFHTELVQRKKPNNLSSIQMSNNFSTIDLSKSLLDMSVDDVCTALSNDIYGIREDFMDVYKSIFKEKNINGQVLSICDLDELKDEARMTFGDWQLFRNWVLSKRGYGGPTRHGLIQSPTISPINDANAAAYELAGFVNNSFRYDSNAVRQNKYPAQGSNSLLTINTNNLQTNGNKMRKVDFYLHSNKQSDDLATGLLNTSTTSKLSNSLVQNEEIEPLITNEHSPYSRLVDSNTTAGLVESSTRTTLIADESLCEIVKQGATSVANTECSPLLAETRESAQQTSPNQREQIERQQQNLGEDEEELRKEHSLLKFHEENQEFFEILSHSNEMLKFENNKLKKKINAFDEEASDDCDANIERDDDDSDSDDDEIIKKNIEANMLKSQKKPKESKVFFFVFLFRLNWTLFCSLFRFVFSDF
jgi:ankyrin repeat-rich membrane spanning protein